MKIHDNNVVTIFFLGYNRSGSQSKYFDVKYLIFEDHIKKNEVMNKHIKTGFMIEDPMTKGLFAQLRDFDFS